MRTRAGLWPGILALNLVASLGAAEAQDIKPRSIKVSYGTAADHPFGLGVNKFAEIVGKKTDGEVHLPRLPRTVSSGPRSPPFPPRKAGCWR